MREPNPQNIFKLTPEQMKTYQRWVDEDVQFAACMKQGFDCLGAGNTAEADEYFEQAQNALSSVCEHCRSIWSTCMACDEIYYTLFPEETYWREDG